MGVDGPGYSGHTSHISLHQGPSLSDPTWQHFPSRGLISSHHFQLRCHHHPMRGPLSRPITHNKAISALSLDSVKKLLSGPNFTLVSALHPPHPVRELRVSSSVFRPGCSQHSVVAPSSNFNHNFVHLEALKTSQSVVFPHQPLLPQPAAGAVSSVKLPTSVIELLFCKLILIVKSVLCQDSHSSQSRGLSCCHFFTFTLFYQFTAIPRPPSLPSPEFAVVYCVHFIF